MTKINIHKLWMLILVIVLVLVDENLSFLFYLLSCFRYHNYSWTYFVMSYVKCKRVHKSAASNNY